MQRCKCTLTTACLPTLRQLPAMRQDAAADDDDTAAEAERKTFEMEMDKAWEDAVVAWGICGLVWIPLAWTLGQLFSYTQQSPLQWLMCKYQELQPALKVVVTTAWNSPEMKKAADVGATSRLQAQPLGSSAPSCCPAAACLAAPAHTSACAPPSHRQEQPKTTLQRAAASSPSSLSQNYLLPGQLRAGSSPTRPLITVTGSRSTRELTRARK